ncbi:MAG: peptidylprolyl isomerase [Verrucomicrobiales bacterium]|nr:peptidylprolyl isomerase [Verrucomicrobiales bacterium]
MKKLPWRSAFYLVVLLYLFIDLKTCNGPLKRKIAESRPSSSITLEKARQLGWVALVNQEPITQNQLNLAVARHLYQRGKSFEETPEKALLQIKRASLRGLIDDVMIRQYADGVDFEAPDEEKAAFIQSWENQFHNKRELADRTEFQELSETEVKEQLGKIWSRKRWLEKRIEPGLGVTDEEVKSWFEANRDNESLKEPEKIRARQIFISTVEEDGDEQEAAIKTAHRRITEDEEDFAEVARELSEDERTREHGGDLNWFSRKRVPDEFAKVVFDQTVNQIGEPFKTKIGWHLVEVTDHQPARPVNFEDVAEEIKIHLLNEQKVDKVNELLGKLRKVAHIIVFTENLN